MIIYLMKYKVNYTFETKYKVFKSFEEATLFHKNYKHHVLNHDYGYNDKIAFITHYEILVLDTDFNQTLENQRKKI